MKSSSHPPPCSAHRQGSRWRPHMHQPPSQQHRLDTSGLGGHRWSARSKHIPLPRCIRGSRQPPQHHGKDIRAAKGCTVAHGAAGLTTRHSSMGRACGHKACPAQHPGADESSSWL